MLEEQKSEGHILLAYEHSSTQKNAEIGKIYMSFYSLTKSESKIANIAEFTPKVD